MNLLSYTDQGTGTPIVFLHGFCEDKSLWKGFVQLIISSYRIICIDLPNFGGSPEMSDASMEKIADACNTTLHHLNVEKCILIGHSLGGYVGLAMADLFPKKLLGLGLFHSTAFEDTPERKEGRNKAIANIKENGVEPFVRTLIPSLFSPIQKQQNAEVKPAIEQLIEKAKQIPAQNLIYTLEAMRNRKERIDIIEQADFPILFIIGKDDGAVPLEMSMAQCYLPKNSMVNIMAEVGHMGMIEAVSKCQKIVNNFIAYCL